MDSGLSQRIQDAFVYLCITDSSFLRICRGCVPLKCFPSQVTEKIVSLCYQYWDQFHEAPQNHFHDEVARYLSDKDDDTVEIFINYLQKIQGMDPPSKNYILSRFNHFLRTSELRNAILQSAKLITEDKLDEAQKIIHQALKSGVPREETGIKYFHVEKPSYLDEDECEYLMPTGWPILDQFLRRGLCRTDLVCILGGAKGKKSWAMVHMGKIALTHGLKVLHISHELSDVDTELRYDRCLGVMVKEKEPREVVFEIVDENGNLIEEVKQKVPSVYNIEEVRRVREEVRRLGGELIIKKYPIGTCTVAELERYLDFLESYEGFIPDVVINDYPEKMKLPSGEYRRDGIHNIYINMKRIAEERKQLWLTVSQVPRSALRKAILDKDDFAEDIRKLEDVDLVIAISHSRIQAQMNQMQAFVLANRHGPDTFGCRFNYQLDAGQLVVSCWSLVNKEEEQDEREQ